MEVFLYTIQSRTIVGLYILEPDAQNLRLVKMSALRPFYPFFAYYMSMFYKTGVQMIISSYRTGLKLDWFKSYDTKLSEIIIASIIFDTL